jgi:hypothetical protein
MFESDDGTIAEDSILHGRGPRVLEAGRLMGKTMEVVQYAKQRIQEAGFVDVREHKFKLPIGPWSSDPKMKELGLWNLLFFLQDIEGFCLIMCAKVMGVSIDTDFQAHRLIFGSGSTPRYRHTSAK